MPLDFNFDNGYAVFTKGRYKTRKHSHYAIEIVFCIDGSFSISTDISTVAKIQSVIIPPNLPHSFNSMDANCNLLFIDPLSDLGTYFFKRFDLANKKNPIINPAELNQFHCEGRFDMPLILNNAKAFDLNYLDPRITESINTINTLITENKLSVSQLSKASFLSESRLAHLFKSQLGISVHQCILWKKILVAVLKSQEGCSLTACAHYAGFADSSHFYKVFYKMFGVKPFFVLKD